MNFLNEIASLVNSYPDKDYLHGETPKSAVTDIERELEVTLPDDYREFIQRYGYGGFGGEDIYGGTQTHSGLPSVIWSTKDQRKCDPKFPKHFVKIYSSGICELGCLDTSKLHNGICPVVAWDLHGDNDDPEILAESFGVFVCELFKETLEDEIDGSFL